MAKNPKLKFALRCIKRGWAVIPLQWVNDGKCSCSNPDCQSVAKHPLTSRGVKDATTDENTIRGWWEKHPNANIGVATGAISGIVVVDVDPRHDGQKSLRRIQRKFGALPAGPCVKTGGGGTHLYFAHPGATVKNKVSLYPGIDIRGDQGYVVAPGSRHASGERYLWSKGKKPSDIDVPSVPAWLLRTRPEEQVGSKQKEDDIKDGNRNVTLTSLAGAMRARQMSPKSIEAALLAENRERCNPPLQEAEVRNIAKSISQYPVRVHSRSWPDRPQPDAFYGLAGEIVKAIEPHSEADPVALLIQLIVGFGNVVGRKPFFRVEADRHSLNLFAVLIGRSSKGRKGTSLGHVLRILSQTDSGWNENCVQSGISTGEGLIYAVRDPVFHRKWVRRSKSKNNDDDGYAVKEEAGVDDKRLLAVEPEFAQPLKLMAREGNILSTVIRQAWDSGDLRTLTKNSPTKSTGAHISIIGHISEGELRKYLKETEQANGFGNRFLWFCSERSKFLPEGGNVPEEELQAFVERLEAAVKHASRTQEMQRSEQARQKWHSIYPELSTGKPGLVGAMTGRAEAQVTRLSMIYALLDCSKIIKLKHLNAALALWGYVEDSVLYTFGNALGDRTADLILSALRQNPKGMSRTQISSLFSNHRGASQLADALEELSGTGQARSERVGTDGRTEERWFANR